MTVLFGDAASFRRETIMKKILAAFLALAMLLLLAACSSDSPAETTADTTVPAETTAQTQAATEAVTEPSTEAVTEAAEATAPEGYPAQSVNLVVGSEAGSSTDLNNRLMAASVAQRLGGSIDVRNLAGGSGAVAVSQYQAQPNDGYTLVGISTAALLDNAMSGACPYGFRDMEVIGIFGREAGEMDRCSVWLAPRGTDAAIVEYLARLMRDAAENDKTYMDAQREINLGDPFVLTGQEAAVWLTAAEATARNDKLPEDHT